MKIRVRLAAAASCLALMLSGCSTADTSAESTVQSNTSEKSTESNDSGETTQQGPEAQPRTDSGDDLAVEAAPVYPEVTEQNATYTVAEYLEATVQDLDTRWTPWFVGNGYQEPYVSYYIIGSEDPNEYVSKCHFEDGSNVTVTNDTANAYYCGLDAEGQGAIWLPSTTFEKMWFGDMFGKSSSMGGDFAAGIIVAHEFGHHVTDELTIQSSANYEVAKITGANNELIADCFAGVWASTMYYDNRLDGTDFDEAVAALYAIGDEPGAKRSHGTPDERVAALKLGYNTEMSPSYCISEYWK